MFYVYAKSHTVGVVPAYKIDMIFLVGYNSISYQKYSTARIG